MKRILKVGSLLTITSSLILGGIPFAFAEKLILNHQSSVYMNSIDAKKETNAVKVYLAGEYYVYKRYNGMVNITKTEGQPGAWISEKYLSEITSVEKTTENKVEKKNKTVKVKKNVKTNEFELKYNTKVYINAKDARNEKDARATYVAGKYFIYKEYDGMINITKTEGEPGAWINPDVNVERETKEDEKITSREVEKNVKEENKVENQQEETEEKNITTEKLYSLQYFRYYGIIKWEGYKFSYYSQKVLPGYGLKIPGRHVNDDGYVSDKDGYIVVAHKNAPKGSVIDTPFGYKAKVYDRCSGCALNQYDVYID